MRAVRLVGDIQKTVGGAELCGSDRREKAAGLRGLRCALQEDEEKSGSLGFARDDSVEGRRKLSGTVGESEEKSRSLAKAARDDGVGDASRNDGARSRREGDAKMAGNLGELY